MVTTIVYLNDFINVSRRIARWRLERIETGRYNRALLHWGIMALPDEEISNPIVEVGLVDTFAVCVTDDLPRRV